MNREEKGLLIIRYLDNTLQRENLETLEGLLRSDPETAELFYDLSIQNVLLHRIGKEAKVRGDAYDPKRKPFFLAVLSAAALIFIAAGIVFYMISIRYPIPEMDGVKLERDVTLTTEDTKQINLGGYCEITCKPSTVITLKGTPFKEAVFLEKGMITCEVDSNTGEFDVFTEIGVVSVQGTEFSVHVEKNTKDANSKADSIRMEVQVMQGKVAVRSDWGEHSLAAGGSLLLPPPDEKTALPEKEEIVTGPGPMIIQGENIYTVSGPTLSRIDSASGKIAVKKDLSSLKLTGMEAHALQWGLAMLFIKGENLCMVRNGILFLFNSKTLDLIKVVVISDSALGGKLDMLEMKAPHEGPGNRQENPGKKEEGIF